VYAFYIVDLMISNLLIFQTNFCYLNYTPSIIVPFQFAVANASVVLRNALYWIEIHVVFIETANQSLWNKNPHRKHIQIFTYIILMAKYGIGDNHSFWAFPRKSVAYKNDELGKPYI